MNRMQITCMVVGILLILMRCLGKIRAEEEEVTTMQLIKSIILTAVIFGGLIWILKDRKQNKA